MVKLRINRSHLTAAFWSAVLEGSAFTLHTIISELQDQHRLLEAGRRRADVNTGSVSFASGVCIAAAAAYFQPRLVCEVGTFLGRSAFSLLRGAASAGANPPAIHTCDFSNDIPLQFEGSERVTRYPRKSSTEMFASLVADSLIPDLYFIDGRLGTADAELLQKLQAEKALIFLDDFVGVEKGVSNAMLIQQAFPENFLLAYPCPDAMLTSLGICDSSVVAALIPAKNAVFVN